MDQLDPVNLLFETSPYGSLDAIVEHDGRAVFFYLSGQGRSDDHFGTRACWVRNLVPGPFVMNDDELKQGIPTLLPRTHCKYSDGRPIPEPDRLDVIWFEEGNGAALVETSDSGTRTTLAVIPPWSRIDNFHGYAEECAAETTICWPLPAQIQLFERIDRAREFWRACQSSEDHPFTTLQKDLLASYAAVFGTETQYYSVDGGHFPPRGLATYEFDNQFIAATVGMSLCPQPMVELHVDHPKNFRRIEIAIRLTEPVEPNHKNKILQQISGLSSMPWRQWTWIGPNHVCQFDSIAPVRSDSQHHAKFVRDGSLNQDDRPVAMPSFRGDPVHLLWLVPDSGPHSGSSAKNMGSEQQLQ